jgi:hypothetical protein
MVHAAAPGEAGAQTHTAQDRDRPRCGRDQLSYPETQQVGPEHPRRPARRTSEEMSRS